MEPPRKRDVRRFWEKVAVGQADECWEGVGVARRPTGHWIFHDSRTGSGIAAHRFAYELANGPIPDGLVVCHACDNPPCVNPAHLWTGTQRDNIADSIAKGRTDHKGESNAAAKLTESEVRTIREMYESGRSQKWLAGLFGVTQANISMIVIGDTWIDAGGPIAERKRKPLTQEDADAIRLYYERGATQEQIAGMYRISRSMVSMIVNRKRW